ncbi:S-adenosylmethionine-dependent methyltransferase [Melia azedarach]|uniref:S-adenosylmethionine-dependent methyltransferase n=1 Tax=Melia azedarach TaxID=155640 RepID=A0ACC1Y2M2_MELAZ|nr:S-adenosylmethionine-dependent methyltransferase [Melia azedarach]
MENLPLSKPMVGGDGDHSYAKNSTYQGGAVDAAKSLISEAIIEKLDLKTLELDTSKTFRIVDLGCSSGPNTFFAVQNIIEAVEQKFLLSEQQNPSALEFQVFFNDHYDNDFNTLFKSLPQSRHYFAVGVPGSFHGRLFPNSSIHFVHSSYTLHWLSKVPREIVDGNSPSLNEGSVKCNRFVKEVIEAYSTQLKNDMESFLNARAQEVVHGGLMSLVIFAIPDGMPFADTRPGVVFGILHSCLTHLAKMGIISEEKVTSFNVPMHNLTPKQLEALIQTNGNFIIERMEKLGNPKKHVLLSSKGFASMMRAILGGFIREHFGNEFVDQIFDHFTTKIEENYSIFREKGLNMVDLFILLKRVVS